METECLGFAPDTEIYAFRVFTDAQVMNIDIKRMYVGSYYDKMLYFVP